MVNNHVVQKQLRAIGADQLFWGKAERGELHKIMIAGEIIEHVQHGHYEGGFATLVATNHRLLLVDKKPFFLNVVDLRYDMVAEVDYSHNMLAATIHVRSVGKDFRFQSFNQKKLRSMTSFIQFKIVDIRRQAANQQANPIPAGLATATDHGHKTHKTNGQTRQAIPMQVFHDDTELTDAQANGLLPLDQATWYKINPARHLANPYGQGALAGRRRVGRFDLANSK